MLRLAACVCLAAGAAAPAQIRPDTGPPPPPTVPPEAPGDVLAGPFHWQAMTGGNAVLGVEHAWGHLWVTFRNSDGPGSAPVVGRPHKLAKFRTDGVLVAVFDQASAYDPVPGPTASPWGNRDGAADEPGNRLYFGREGGRVDIYTYEPATGRIGGKTTRVVTGLEGVTIRALCRRDDTGRFIAGNFSGRLHEFTLNGATASYANALGPGGAPLRLYGLAWADLPGGGRLWAWGQSGSPAAAAVEATVGPGGLAPTGVRFQGRLLAQYTGAVAGGADVFCENGAVVLAAVHQGRPADHAVLYDTGSDCGGGCPCACDFDTGTGPRACDIFDFLAFQNAFSAGEPCACDLDTLTGPGSCDIFDFLGFQNAFDAGCP